MEPVTFVVSVTEEDDEGTGDGQGRDATAAIASADEEGAPSCACPYASTLNKSTFFWAGTHNAAASEVDKRWCRCWLPPGPWKALAVALADTAVVESPEIEWRGKGASPLCACWCVPGPPVCVSVGGRRCVA